MAAETKYTISRYSPSNHQVTSILEGLKVYQPDQLQFDYAKGCEIINESWPNTELLPVPLTEAEEARLQKL